MTPEEIITKLKSMGNRSVHFFEDGSIVSLFGAHTVNYWAVIEGKLVCVNCRTIY